MENNEKVLIEVGLSEEQSLVYSALLDKGAQKASILASWTGIKRGLIYKVLEQLEAMGLVSKKGGEGTVAVFSPEHPSRLMDMMDQKEKSLALAKETISFSLGSLASKYNLLSGKPNVQFYEGMDGAQKVIDDSLSIEKNGEILQYVDSETILKFIPNENKEYVAKRKKLGFKKKILVPNTVFMKNRVKEISTDDIEIRFLTEPTPFSTTLQIYGDKISYLTLTENKKIGIIIEDKDIASFHRSLFLFAWEKAQQILDVEKNISVE